MLYRSSVDYFSLFLHQFNIYEKKRKSDEQLAYSQGIKTQHYINVSEKKKWNLKKTLVFQVQYLYRNH